MLYTRDLNGRITTIKNTIGHTMRYAHDANGNRTRSTDSNGRFTDYTFNPKWNTIASVTRHMDTGDKMTRTMEYDPNTGRMLKGTDALGNTTTLLRDLVGRITQATDPLG